MSALQSILVTAASGNIGKVLTPLLASKHLSLKLVLPTSDARKLTETTGSNVVVEEGSIRDPIWLESILKKHNVDGVFLCVTGVDEMITAVNCLDAISKAGTVKKLVYVSIMGDLISETGLKTTFAERSYAHILAKVVIELKLLHGKYPFAWTVLGLGNFFVNDHRLKVPITQLGLYAQPNVAAGMSRVSLEDISLAATNVLSDTTGKWDGQKVMVGSKHSYTTEEETRLWSQALNKPLQTQPATKEVLDQVEQTLRQMMGPGLDGLAFARNLRLMQEYVTVHGLHLGEADYSKQVELLGKEPDDYGSFVKRTAAAWTSASST